MFPVSPFVSPYGGQGTHIYKAIFTEKGKGQKFDLDVDGERQSCDLCRSPNNEIIRAEKIKQSCQHFVCNP